LRFLLATLNRGKLRELQAVLSGLGIELVSLDDYPDVPEAVEDGKTFAENARKKALHYWRFTSLPTIADDSGLMVDALGGDPGVYSARIASDDPSRIRTVLERLEQIGPETSRRARFVCCLCAILGRDQRIEVEGTVEGQITTQARGSRGFGYDPIFLYEPLGRTFAELSAEEKNAVSHRAVALQKLKVRLREELGER
jgi:XTP/dITP diphosphohydrolase